MLGFGDDLLCFFYPLFFNQIFIGSRRGVRVRNRLYSRRCRRHRGQRRQYGRGWLGKRGRIAGGAINMLLTGLLFLWLLWRLFRLVYNRKSLTPLEVSRTVLWCSRW